MGKQSSSKITRKALKYFSNFSPFTLFSESEKNRLMDILKVPSIQDAKSLMPEWKPQFFLTCDVDCGDFQALGVVFFRLYDSGHFNYEAAIYSGNPKIQKHYYKVEILNLIGEQRYMKFAEKAVKSPDKLTEQEKISLENIRLLYFVNNLGRAVKPSVEPRIISVRQ